MIHQFLPPDWKLSEHLKRAYEHSKTVANAARIIANRVSTLDEEVAYTFGIMHDVGKFYLPEAEKYKHPRVGYELLRDKYPNVALICLTHPFPDFGAYEHILHYHHNDESEAKKVFELLSQVERTPYMELIQFCDKISRVNDYIPWEKKLDWYLKTYGLDPNEMTKQYSVHLQKIKRRLDDMAGEDIYKLLKIQP